MPSRDRTASCKTTRERAHPGPHHTSQEHSEAADRAQEEAKKAGLDLELNLVDGTTGFKGDAGEKHEAAWLGWGRRSLSRNWESFPLRQRQQAPDQQPVQRG